MMKNSPPSYNHGIAIGGPADGKFIKTDLDFVRVPVFPEPQTRQLPHDSPPDNATATSVTYHRTNFHFGGKPEESLHFWLPENMTLAEALQRLTGRYQRHSPTAKA